MTVTAGAELADRVRAGEALACARLMSLAERGDARFPEQYGRFHAELGRARRFGITGPPGAGKSTLVERLALHWRAAGHTLGIVAVDPTSPFSGGALLGDRVRMSRLALDAGVFIRSMATRGLFGGLARASDDVVDVLDLYGRDTILIETVGVGQSEVDIARSADLTVVVLHPGGGDTIQAMKAGLMEVADVYLVNKADMPGLDRLVAQLTDILDLRDIPHELRPPILTSVAATGQGVAALAAELDRMHAERAASGVLAARRAANLEKRVRRLVDGRLRQDIWETFGLAGTLARRLSQPGPHSAWGLAGEILDIYRNARPSESDA
ncbi:MAG TPA: methylmalonyl Co-A mutase-associated GTPase MeaB [Planctomycetota bacterium]|nr:methylmalonyl Co-A mutase-associated GTPase MeaB [Planctomycetota bacterium]